MHQQVFLNYFFLIENSFYNTDIFFSHANGV